MKFSNINLMCVLQNAESKKNNNFVKKKFNLIEVCKTVTPFLQIYFIFANGI